MRKVLLLGLICSRIAVLGQELLVDQASGELDQITTGGATVPDGGSMAQSFTPRFPGIDFVQVRVGSYPNSPGDFWVNLRAKGPDGPLLSSTDPIFIPFRATRMETFYFPGIVPLIPEQPYFFEFVPGTGARIFVAEIDFSPYTRGSLYGNNGPPSATVDVWFREGVVVPEPAPVCLGIMGLTVLASCKRRRKTLT